MAVLFAAVKYLRFSRILQEPSVVNDSPFAAAPRAVLMFNPSEKVDF